MDWPDRFVQSCLQARTTQSRLLSDWGPPYWFASAVRERLDRSGYTPTAEEAKHAAAYLNLTQQSVSGKSVGRLIGNPDSMAAIAYRKQKPRPMTEEEVERFFAGIDEAILSKPKGSQTRLILERDRTIFWFMRLTGWTASHVLGLTVADAVRLAETACTEEELPAAARGVLLNYLRDVRQHLAGEMSGNALFVGPKGGGIGVKNLGLRWQQALKLKVV